MSDLVTLSAKPRTVLGKQVALLRRNGITPIVVYGHGKDPVALQVETKALSHTLNVAGSSRVIALQVEGENRPRMTLVRDVQRHVTRLGVIHADFLEVAMDVKVRSEVNLDFIGEPQLVNRHEALVEHDLNHLTIEALPAELPSSLVVDCSAMEHIGDTITVADLATGKFQILHDHDVVVARLQPISRKVEVDEGLEAEGEAEAAEPEVITARSRDTDAG
jgi:large subunit ribosomal protein L25